MTYKQVHTPLGTQYDFEAEFSGSVTFDTTQENLTISGMIDSLCIINTPHGRYYEGLRVKSSLLVSSEADMISMVVNYTIDKYKSDKFVLDNPSDSIVSQIKK